MYGSSNGHSMSQACHPACYKYSAANCHVYSSHLKSTTAEAHNVPSWLVAGVSGLIVAILIVVVLSGPGCSVDITWANLRGRA